VPLSIVANEQLAGVQLLLTWRSSNHVTALRSFHTYKNHITCDLSAILGFYLRAIIQTKATF